MLIGLNIFYVTKLDNSDQYFVFKINYLIMMKWLSFWNYNLLNKSTLQQEF